MGTTETLQKFQGHVLQASEVTIQGHAEAKAIIAQTFADAAHAMDALTSSSPPTSATCPVAMSTGAAPSAARMVFAGAVPFTQATYDDIDKSIASSNKVAQGQLFVAGRVGLL